ncbi:hypothetical protein N7466_011076 [Penicillium verhagenii]|uniref:uncharacterized protein n=1 Tax=Penicillium verhagenii TaxID=1562060 RepID=UPI0025456205|nr:uncharacterized protein N7466_011076 [Penicillium verhagenii]KAJ5917522.1 hypothetical protein N7466_011076 [Penicillium verhagenii]
MFRKIYLSVLRLNSAGPTGGWAKGAAQFVPTGRRLRNEEVTVASLRVEVRDWSSFVPSPRVEERRGLRSLPSGRGTGLICPSCPPPVLRNEEVSVASLRVEARDWSSFVPSPRVEERRGLRSLPSGRGTGLICPSCPPPVLRNEEVSVASLRVEARDWSSFVTSPRVEERRGHRSLPSGRGTGLVFLRDLP